MFPVMPSIKIAQMVLQTNKMAVKAEKTLIDISWTTVPNFRMSSHKCSS